MAGKKMGVIIKGTPEKSVKKRLERWEKEVLDRLKRENDDVFREDWGLERK